MKTISYILLVGWFWSIPSFVAAQDTSYKIRTGLWHETTVHYHPHSFLVQKQKEQKISTTLDEINTLPVDIKEVEYIAYDWFLVTVRKEIRIELIAELARQNMGTFRQIEPNIQIPVNAIPNDPMFSGNGTRFNVGQWYLKNDGNSYIGGAAGADTKAWKAWDITKGDPNVVVAIFDTGISMNGMGQLNHPDLNDNSRITIGRKYVGTNVDTLNVAEEYDPVDKCYHGTWMSGIVGATQNNSIGLSGVAPQAGILVMKVMSTAACGTTAADVLKGVQYLERFSNDNPEKQIIANFSFGGPGSVSQVFQTIFDETYQNNVLVVVSAGNTSVGSVDSPAKLATKTPQSINHFVSVGSSTHRDEISFRSAQASVTEEITLAAPAGPDSLIYYTWDYGTWLTDAITTGNPLDDSGNQAHTGTDYYRYAGLTSGAAAMTSGVAALI